MAEVVQSSKLSPDQVLERVKHSIVSAARSLARSANITDVAADLMARNENHYDRETGKLQPSSPLNQIHQTNALVARYGAIVACAYRIACSRVPSAEDRKFLIEELEKISGVRLSSQGQFGQQTYAGNRQAGLDSLKRETSGERSAVDPMFGIRREFTEKLSRAVDDQQLLLGRSKEADIFVNLSDVSRRQVTITARENGYLVAKPSDASPAVYYCERGGQWQPLTREVYLRPGDKIRFGTATTVELTLPARGGSAQSGSGQLYPGGSPRFDEGAGLFIGDKMRQEYENLKGKEHSGSPPNDGGAQPPEHEHKIRSPSPTFDFIRNEYQRLMRKQQEGGENQNNLSPGGTPSFNEGGEVIDLDRRESDPRRREYERDRRAQEIAREEEARREEERRNERSRGRSR